MDRRPKTARGTKHDQVREEIAERAARLIEEGETDYSKAARKAAKQLHSAGNHSLPDLKEIDLALRYRQALYSRESHANVLIGLREAALKVMLQFDHFSPWLVGPVLSGTANEHSDIELEMIGIEPKRFEMYLLETQMVFSGPDVRLQAEIASTKSHPSVSYSLSISGYAVMVVIFESHAARQRAYPQHHIRHDRAKREDALRRFFADKDIRN